MEMICPYSGILFGWGRIGVPFAVMQNALSPKCSVPFCDSDISAANTHDHDHNNSKRLGHPFTRDTFPVDLDSLTKCR